MTVGVIRQYEQGKREPGYSALVKLARGLGTTIGAFHPPDVEPAPAKKPPRKKTS